MSIVNILELFLYGIFLVFFLFHIPLMAWVMKTNGGFLNRKLVLYTVVSILPILLTGACLFFGPKDLSSVLDLSGFYWGLVGYLIVNLLFCVVFLFTGLSSLPRSTRVKVLLSTIVASVTSWLAFLGATYVTL